MKISKVIERLEAIKERDGDVDAMFQDPNSHGGPFPVTSLDLKVAQEDEYPNDFNMPKGFKFVLLENW